jgi:hypothetical protein
LNGFQTTRSSYSTAIRDIINTLTTEFINTKRIYLNRQRAIAREVNILDILGFTHDEVRHSKFVAWLFDSWETHAQGNLFFRLFLEKVRLPLKYAEIRYDVKTEVTRDESRIDIEIASVNRGSKSFVIHIENKVNAILTDNQISREYADLQRAKLEKGASGSNVHGFVLSIDEPDISLSKYKFRWISWKTMAIILNKYIKSAEAERTRWAAQQYLECIEKNVVKEHIMRRSVVEEVKEEK